MREIRIDAIKPGQIVSVWGTSDDGSGYDGLARRCIWLGREPNTWGAAGWGSAGVFPGRSLLCNVFILEVKAGQVVDPTLSHHFIRIVTADGIVGWTTIWISDTINVHCEAP